MKERLDLLLEQRGLVPEGKKAQSLIMAGLVLVDDVPVTKPGTRVSVEAEIRLKGGQPNPYVSRGGFKLAGALKEWKIPVQGRTALDIGASTGGFTDVLLQNGAEKVFAVDVGKGLLDWKIRSNPRVVLLEETNARHLDYDAIGQQVDLIVMDVSFISILKILPALKPFAHPKTDWITLIKPQFELPREKVGPGGIVREPESRSLAVQQVTENAERNGLKRLGLLESSIKGTDGNQEFLALWRSHENINEVSS